MKSSFEKMSMVSDKYWVISRRLYNLSKEYLCDMLSKRRDNTLNFNAFGKNKGIAVPCGLYEKYIKVTAITWTNGIQLRTGEGEECGIEYIEGEDLYAICKYINEELFDRK